MSTTRHKKGQANAGWGPWPWILGLLLVAMVGAMVWRNTRSPAVSPTDTLAKSVAEVQARAKAAEPAGTQSFPNEGTKHVGPQEKVQYKTDPPTSGDHWEAWAKPGFHAEAPETGRLVHNLEHGHVVIYYDRAKLAAADLAGIRQLADKFKGDWDAVLAVPRTDAEHPVVLTAWQNMLKLPAWDPAQAEKFVDAFRGRGPEQPIR